MRNVVVLLIMVLVMLTKANAEVRVEKVALKKQAGKAQMVINFKGDLMAQPSLQFKPDTIQVTLPDGVVWPKIEKMATIKDSFDTKLLAYQYDKGTARIRTILPYSISGREEDVTLNIDNNQMIVTFPTANKAAKAPIAKKVSAKDLDEKYLDKLIDESSIKKSFKANTVAKKAAKAPSKASSDTVNSTLAGVTKLTPKSSKSSFSVMSYAGKFVAFLGVVLLLFYGVINIFRKGVTKKGRMSFLGSTKQVEVLNTTYVSPKKTLMMVRAHKQIFLVSNTEQGMSLISEVKDPVGLLKGEEKDLAGTNFDQSFQVADADENIESKVKLKEKDLSLSEFLENQKDGNSEANSAMSAAEQLVAQGAVKEKVKFSDQIKKKVKGLKPLQ